MTTLLSINNYFYIRGGAEGIFFEHNRLLESLGWNVVPFAMHHPNNLPTPWSEHFVDELELGSNYSLAGNVARASKVIYSFEARRKLDRLLKLTRPDLAHGHNIYHHLSPSILGLLKSRGIPTILTLHDLKLACPAYSMLTHDGVCERCRGGRIHNVVVHRCIRNSTALSLVVLLEVALHNLLGSYRKCVDRFIVPSRFFLEKFAEWGLPREQFRHVPNFVDVKRYEPNFTAGRGFVYFGRVIRQKGLATLIRAAAQARVPLQIAGTGPDLEAMRELAQQLNAEVRFLGHLNGSVLHETVRNSRAVVLPSEAYENAPVSILEAYALGKPAIGARLGGIPELIRENETGLSFESGNVESLTAALRDLASRPDAQIEALGRRGRQWVQADFTPGMYLRRILEVYGEVGVRIPAADISGAGFQLVSAGEVSK
jgi:glycosyltransferase involved in cell wall biosynthesis